MKLKKTDIENNNRKNVRERKGKKNFIQTKNDAYRSNRISKRNEQAWKKIISYYSVLFYDFLSRDSLSINGMMGKKKV